MPKPKSNRSVPLNLFLKSGKTDSYCKKCKTQWTAAISSDELTKHINKCRGVPNAVPIPNAGKGRPLRIEMEKNAKKKERKKEKQVKNTIAKAEKKRAAAEAKEKADVKGKGKKGKSH